MPKDFNPQPRWAQSDKLRQAGSQILPAASSFDGHSIAQHILRPTLYIVRRVPQAAFRRFAMHHYKPHLPGPNKATYLLSAQDNFRTLERELGIVCYTLPPLASAARNQVFGPLFRPSFTNRVKSAKLAALCITTLSRMVILPQHQPQKLAAPFLAATAATFDTPIIEAHTIIGRTLRFFQHAGMRMTQPPTSRYTKAARLALHQAGIDPADGAQLPSLIRHIEEMPAEKAGRLIKILTTWHVHHLQGPYSAKVGRDTYVVLEDVALNLFQVTYYAYSARSDYLTFALRHIERLNTPLLQPPVGEPIDARTCDKDNPG